MLHFLWVNDVHQEEPEVVILRFARVVVGVSSSPLLQYASEISVGCQELFD